MAEEMCADGKHMGPYFHGLCAGCGAEVNEEDIGTAVDLVGGGIDRVVQVNRDVRLAASLLTGVCLLLLCV